MTKLTAHIGNLSWNLYKKEIAEKKQDEVSKIALGFVFHNYTAFMSWNSESSCLDFYRALMSLA